jgi:twitching motility protein PilT
MAQLDKLIEKIQPGQEIILEAGKTPALKREGGSSPMLSQLLSLSQVVGLIQEISPAGSREAVGQRKPVKFEYLSGARTVLVACEPDGDQFIARLSLGVGGKAAEACNPAALQYTPAEPEPEINALLRKMFKKGASDLHLTSCQRPMARVNGDMTEFGDEPVLKNDHIVALVAAIMPPHSAVQFAELHDADFAYEITGLARFRVNVFLDRFGMGAVFRQIPIEIVTAEKLGLSKEMTDLCFLSKGLVLVTGPTGSGKSTTLCALVDYINRHRRDHIITIEDPIEFVHNRKNCLINQREVHVHTKSFSQALRAALREDPDIVLVGEMRDLETISIAIETAETGHLVFGTLHTTTAASTVDRIIDQFPADRQAQIRTMLSTSLKAVISQTLCKKIGGGRVAAMEALFVTSAVSNLIREGKIYQIPSIMQTGKKQGMTVLNDALFKLVLDKQVEPEEAYIKSTDKPAFVAMLKTKSIVLKLGELEE